MKKMHKISIGDLIFDSDTIFDDYEYRIEMKKNVALLRNKLKGTHANIILSRSVLDFMSFNRILCRLFRTNKCNALRLSSGDFIFFRQNQIYKYVVKTEVLEKLYHIPSTRNVMQNSLCRFGKNGFIFGDYFSNPNRGPVLLRWTDNMTTNPLNSFDLTDIVPCRHVHNVQYLDVLKQFIVCTGDNDGECWLLLFDKNLNYIKRIGDGSQSFRTCSVHMFNGKLYWAMDSPLEKSFLLEYSLDEDCSREIFELSGPCLYSIQKDNLLFITTSAEPSEIASIPSLQVFDLNSEKLLFSKQFKKDLYPFIFKFGVGTLVDSGDNKVIINYEALKSIDGCSQELIINQM